MDRLPIDLSLLQFQVIRRVAEWPSGESLRATAVPPIAADC